MIQISDFYSEAARATVTARAEAAEPGHQRHRPHRRYFRSATQSKKDFAANQGMEWVKRCDKGSLEPVWRAVVARPRRQRRGGDAAPSCSGDLPKVPYFDPRGGGPPPGVGGKRRSACQTGLLLRLRIGRYRYVAQHRIALREARALPPSHIISHSLRAVALCRRWQRWSIDNIDLKVSARQGHLCADRG